MALDKVWIKGDQDHPPILQDACTKSKISGGTFTTAFIEKDLEKYYLNSEYEEMLAAWLAQSFSLMKTSRTRASAPDFENGKEMSPWLLNKRINQF